MRVPLILIVCAGLVTAACGSAGSPGSLPSPAPSATEIAPVDAVVPEIVASTFIFRPASIDVPVGATVTWRNTDQILHTATGGTPDAPSGMFDGQLDGDGSSFTYTFNEPGTYAFYCSRHLQMRGEVTVH